MGGPSPLASRKTMTQKPDPHSASATEAAALQLRLASIGLDPDGLASLAKHAEQFVPRIDAVLARFYVRLQQQPELAAMLNVPGLMPRLIAAQRAYAAGLFTPAIDAAYVAERLRIGETHHRVRLTPQWYLSAYAVLTEELVCGLLEQGAIADALTMLQRLLFDASLTLDAYGMCTERDVTEAAEASKSSRTEGPTNRPIAMGTAPSGSGSGMTRVRLTMENAEQRRDFLGLDATAQAELHAAAPVLLRAVPAVLQDFYRFFSAHPMAERLVPPPVVARLQQQVASYWHELAHGTFDRPYAASRMRIGIVHERIGLSSQWYLTGLGRQLAGLVATLWRDHPNASGAVRALLRAAYFDATFVVDAYMEARAESVLRNEGYATRLVASLTAGICIIDDRHRVISANRSLLDLAGIDAAMLQHMPVATVLPIAALDEMLSQLDASRGTRVSAQCLFAGRRLRMTALHLQEGDATSHIAIVLEDITELQSIANVIDQEASEMAALIHAAPDVLWAVELPSWTVLSISRQVLALTGRRDLAYVGRADAWLAQLPESDRERLRRLAQTMQPGHSAELEHRIDHQDGGSAWALTRLRRLTKRDGREILVATTTDVTAMRDQGERRLREIGQLAGGVAHELNNALTAVMGELQLLDLDGLRPELDESRRRGLAACDRAAQVTRQLLAFAQRQVLRPQRLDLGIFLHQLRPKLANVLGPGCNLELAAQGSALHCNVDPQQFENALVQLVANAREAMAARGTLSIACFAIEERNLALVVRDDGHGMTTESAARAFEPFFTTRPGRGAGLGLSMVQGFVRQSGGEIHLESVLGAGTTVHLRLPRAIETADPATATGPRQKPALLIVEDDAMVRDIILRAAAAVGFRTLAVATAEQALETLESTTVDAMFADIMLGPGMDGLSLALQLRGRMPELPITLSSGYLASQFSRAEELREFAFLEKPFPMAALKAALTALITATTRRARGPLTR